MCTVPRTEAHERSEEVGEKAIPQMSAACAPRRTSCATIPCQHILIGFTLSRIELTARGGLVLDV